MDLVLLKGKTGRPMDSVVPEVVALPTPSTRGSFRGVAPSPFRSSASSRQEPRERDEREEVPEDDEEDREVPECDCERERDRDDTLRSSSELPLELEHDDECVASVAEEDDGWLLAPPVLPPPLPHDGGFTAADMTKLSATAIA